MSWCPSRTLLCRPPTTVFASPISTALTLTIFTSPMPTTVLSPPQVYPSALVPSSFTDFSTSPIFHPFCAFLLAQEHGPSSPSRTIFQTHLLGYFNQATHTTEQRPPTWSDPPFPMVHMCMHDPLEPFALPMPPTFGAPLPQVTCQHQHYTPTYSLLLFDQIAHSRSLRMWPLISGLSLPHSWTHSIDSPPMLQDCSSFPSDWVSPLSPLRYHRQASLGLAPYSIHCKFVCVNLKKGTCRGNFGNIVLMLLWSDWTGMSWTQ